MLGACAQAGPAGGPPAFGVLGDAPYTNDEVRRLDRLIDEMNGQPLAFVVHVGDIGTREACGDEWLRARKQQFGRLEHPFILIPGDNEWSDCKDPLARLAAWRKLFCFQEKLAVERQPGAFCEHLRWEAGGLLFVTLNVQGSNNNVRHPEHAPRMKAVLAWLDEAAARAKDRRGLIVLMQANPFITLPRDGYAPLRERLAELGKALEGRLVLIHGDTHVYKDDEPIPGMRRIEVWGSPFVAWHRLELNELPSRSPR